MLLDRAIGIVGFGLLFTLSGVAQSPQPGDGRLRFEVASIKPSGPERVGIFLRFDPGGRFRAQGATVMNLIAYGYGHQFFEISGGPGWIHTDKYDIVAKGEEIPEEDPRFGEQNRLKKRRQRLQSLLLDRFQLKFHLNTKEFPVYALVVAKNGPKLKTAKEADGPMGTMMVSMIAISGHGVPLSTLAAHLSNQFVDRDVVDRTGLSGLYDIKFECTPERAQMTDSASAESSLPSVFSALQEQLGLKLEPQKAPGEVLVIDHIERPSEN